MARQTLRILPQRLQVFKVCLTIFRRYALKYQYGSGVNSRNIKAFLSWVYILLIVISSELLESH